MKTKEASVAVLFVLTVATAAFGQAQTVEKLWETNCAACHGKTGAEGVEGKGKGLLTAQWADGALDKGLFESVRNGPKGAKEHAFGGEGKDKLSDEQVWGLVVFLREQGNRAFPSKAPPVKDGVYSSKFCRFTIEPVIESGLATPWGCDWLPDGTMLITERAGPVKMWKDKVLLTTIEGTPKTLPTGQGGMLDVTVHPDYAMEGNGWVYLGFAAPAPEPTNGRTMTTIVRGRIKDGKWVDEQVIFKAKPEHFINSGVHFGNKIVFTKPDPTGKRMIFFSIGERGSQDMAQDLKRPNGKLHRLYEDGSVPADNPFAGREAEGVYTSIWSYGHRNPQGLVLDEAGELWNTEHAPRGGDEINHSRKGRNYGWPIVSFGINYSGQPFRNPWDTKGSEITMPIFYWLPSIAPCGLEMVRDDRMFSAWKGDLLAGGLAGNCVDRVRIKDDVFVERETVVKGQGRVRDIQVGAGGAIYLVLNNPDKVVRLVEKK